MTSLRWQQMILTTVSGAEPARPDVVTGYGSIEAIRQQLEAAAKTVADLRRRQATVQQRFANLPKRTAAVVYLDQGELVVYAEGSFAGTTMLDTLGLSNVFADLKKNFVKISAEDLLGRNPDVIILTYGGSGTTTASDAAVVQNLRLLPGAGTLNAVKSDRLLPINFTYLVGGVLSVDAVEKLGGEL